MDRAAAVELFEANRGLAYSRARRMLVNAETRQDLEQEALIALYKAALGFDPARGCQFSTYAVPKIRGALQECLRRTGQRLHVAKWAYDRGVRAPAILETDLGCSLEQLLQGEAGIGGSITSVFDMVAASELRNRLSEIIEDTSGTELHKQVLRLVLLSGLSRQEAAKRAGCCWMTADKALRRHLPAIRSKLRDWKPDGMGTRRLTRSAT